MKISSVVKLQQKVSLDTCGEYTPLSAFWTLPSWSVFKISTRNPSLAFKPYWFELKMPREKTWFEDKF